MIHIGAGADLPLFPRSRQGGLKIAIAVWCEFNQALKMHAISLNVTRCLLVIGVGPTLYLTSYRAIQVRKLNMATTSRISEDQLFYCLQRGISEEDAVSLIVNGFCKEVMKELPMEFAVEAQKLIGISLEGSVG